jgi:hypothetical protein
VIWVYAICERAARSVLRDTGLAGAPLEGVGEGELLAVVSRHDEPPEVGALGGLWAHEQVVEGLMADGPVLPMRFGSQVPADGALRTVLTRRHDELLGALNGVRDRVELAVRAMRPGETAPARRDDVAAGAPGHHTGREYVRARLELGDRLATAAASLHAPLAALAAADSRLPARAPGEVLRASYLVDRSAVTAFRGLVQQLQAEHRNLSVLCTGPWPPYSFVDVPVVSAAVADAGRSA